MGIYLNPRNDNFKEFLNSEIFVDKTMILSVLNGIMKTSQKYICISQPRRFGKTYAANLISSYYSKGCDSRPLFERCKISKDASFESNLNKFNSKSDIFAYLLHLGYLSYNDERQECRIPNKEVRLEWHRAVSVTSDYSVTDSTINSSKELMDETINGNESAVAKALEMIIELKRNDCAESAIKQIKEKRYFDSLTSFHGNLLFVGINYDEKTKKHECRIEKLEV